MMIAKRLKCNMIHTLTIMSDAMEMKSQCTDVKSEYSRRFRAWLLLYMFSASPIVELFSLHARCREQAKCAAGDDDDEFS